MGWKGFYGYWKSNGTEVDFRKLNDYWGECSTTEFGNKSNCGNHPYYRYDPELFGEDKVEIFEPCNYASNIAYYHSATRICEYPDWFSGSESAKALKRSYFGLGIGSSFWHGSYTKVGLSFDNRMIAIIAYISHQMSVSSLDTNSSIIKELSHFKRN